MNDTDVVQLLESTMREESRTDERLIKLTERVHQKAETADQAAT